MIDLRGAIVPVIDLGRALGGEPVGHSAEARIAIVEVMGRHAGFIALGAAYGQPDLVLIPEHRIDVEVGLEPRAADEARPE